MATTTLAGEVVCWWTGLGHRTISGTEKVSVEDNIWDREGFGGGQGGYKDSRETPGSPGPGLVLLEIKRK